MQLGALRNSYPETAGLFSSVLSIVGSVGYKSAGCATFRKLGSCYFNVIPEIKLTLLCRLTLVP
jgi:hypothetical protein